MMKLGCMSLSYKDRFAAGTMDLEGFIDRAYELRLDGIDVHTRAFASTEPAYLREIRMRCLKRGLAISYIGVSNDFGRPESELDSAVSEVKEWVDVAAFMGGPDGADIRGVGARRCKRGRGAGADDAVYAGGCGLW